MVPHFGHATFWIRAVSVREGSAAMVLEVRRLGEEGAGGYEGLGVECTRVDVAWPGCVELASGDWVD